MHKDTERADELRSMVQAWEAEQPGRSRKVSWKEGGRHEAQMWFNNPLTLQAQESRQKFLDSWALKDASAAPEEGMCRWATTLLNLHVHDTQI